jgi:hypothetical protein
MKFLYFFLNVSLFYMGICFCIPGDILGDVGPLLLGVIDNCNGAFFIFFSFLLVVYILDVFQIICWCIGWVYSFSLINIFLNLQKAGYIYTLFSVYNSTYTQILTNLKQVSYDGGSN